MFPTPRDFRTMMDRTDTGILIHEAASKNILWANPAACRMFGFSLDELRPLKAHHMSSQEQQYRRALGVAWLQEAVVHGTSRRQWKYRTKSGEDFLTDAVASLVHFQEGPMVMVQFRNIAQEVELQEELSHVSLALQRLMRHTSAGFILLDEHGRIEDISPQAAQLYGRRPQELEGIALQELGPWDPPLGSELVEARMSAGRGPVSLTQEVTRPDGATAWLAGEFEHIEHDGITSRVAVVRDVTEKVELERRHAYQEANLQYLSRYNAMGDMVMVLAHELGQPLAASANYLRGIKARTADDPAVGDGLAYGIEELEKQLVRAGEIVASVKRYVRRIASTSAPIDLNETLEESLYFVRLRAAEFGVDFRVDASPDPLPVHGESVLIGQVIINLCFNALEEIVLPSTEVKELSVRAFRQGGWACVCVKDQGRGITRLPGESLLTGAFSDKQDGSGIGLILAEHIVERHEGQLHFLANEPRGTTVLLRLPLR